METNIFGGKNKNGLYVPMTPDESETLLRLWENKEYDLRILGWGSANIHHVIIGDKRLALQATIGPEMFEHIEIPIVVSVLEVELWARGRKLFGPKKYIMEDFGKPYMVAKGVITELQFDLCIDKINPDLVKEVNSQVRGLTTRLGNMTLDPLQRTLLKAIEEGNRTVAKLEKENLEKVMGKSKIDK